MAIIETINVSKKYRELLAVDHISLSIEEGECFGLLGPNGAGKTTLIRMVTAVSPPSDGRIQIKGKDLATHARQTKAMIGVVPQTDNLDPDLTVLRNLLTFARYFSIPKVEAYRRSIEVLELFQLLLQPFCHTYVFFSGVFFPLSSFPDTVPITRSGERLIIFSTLRSI